MDITFERTERPKTKPSGPLGFGTYFSDHMFRMEFDPDVGDDGAWVRPRIEPYAPMALDPAAAVLHYGQAVFEGMKALYGSDGRIRLFRPDRHAARFHRSCRRLCIPELPDGLFVDAIRKLVAIEKDWVPKKDDASLYIRPFVVASEPFLGIRPARRYVFSIILSPVGSYYAKGFHPVKIWVERRATRAAPGGLGEAKTAANYAASLRASVDAKERGYDQVLWTDAHRHDRLEEVGTMNLFTVIRDEVITAPLEGTILPGITRASIIEMLEERGVRVSERWLSLAEVREAHEKGDLREVFGTGTAAVVSPVGTLGFDDGELVVGDGEPGPLSLQIREDLTALQRARAPDTHGWMVEVPTEPTA